MKTPKFSSFLFFYPITKLSHLSELFRLVNPDSSVSVYIAFLPSFISPICLQLFILLMIFYHHFQTQIYYRSYLHFCLIERIITLNFFEHFINLLVLSARPLLIFINQMLVRLSFTLKLKFELNCLLIRI
jgi:hypothetical protein